MEPVKEEKEQRLQERKKKAPTAEKSYENRQPMEAQTKTKIKYIFVLLIFTHRQF